MIRSMTGFGAAHREVDGARYSVEVRSVNNKFLKATVRLPDALSSLETEIETAVARKLHRGSVIVTVRWVAGGASLAARIDTSAARASIEQLLEEMPEEIRSRCTVDLATLLSVPGIICGDDSQAFVETARPILVSLLGEACDRLIEMRTREGGNLFVELESFGTRMQERLESVASRAPRVVELYRDRLHQRVESLLKEVGASLDESDLVREVAVFAERSDIAEEITRLSGHLEQFFDLLGGRDDEPVGRTLDFLTQEMLREANTISSKSADADITRAVVEVKGLIDRIKEQAANVE